MSANLLDGLTPTLLSGTTAESDGTYHHAARTETVGHQDWLIWDLPDQAALETDQTYHVGLSTKGASANAASLHMTIGYKDAAGKKSWADSPAFAIGTSWGRAEATITVPSGMRPFVLYVAARGVCPETWMTAPTLSLGSPVCLASSAHTPYATQDHVSVTYATKASLKVTDDAVTAEVEERGKLAGRVGTLESTSDTHSSKLEQLATSIKSLVKGESTYTDPDGKSATSGIYSLVTQTRDSVTALFGQYTKTEDLAATDAVKDAKKAGTDAQAAASAAQSTADSAKSTAQDAKKTADGISVGGRNLVLGTGVAATWTAPTIAAGSFKTWDPYDMVAAWSAIGVKAGDPLTLTFDWAVTGAPAGATFRVGTNTDPWEFFSLVVTLAAGSSSGHVAKTVAAPSGLPTSTGSKFRVRIDAVGNAIAAGMTVTLSHVKIERGNKATDYSPAPEDVDAAIGTAQDTANAANNTANSAKSTADAAKADAATAQSTADRAQSTADAALDNAGTANGRARAVEARVSASIDGLDVRVRGVSEAVSAQGATVRDVERNMSFGLDGLVIGAADSASKVRITEKRETFEVDGKTVLALDGDTSTVEASALKIGGYVWTATNGGKNLTLVYRG